MKKTSKMIIAIAMVAVLIFGSSVSAFAANSATVASAVKSAAGLPGTAKSTSRVYGVSTKSFSDYKYYVKDAKKAKICLFIGKAPSSAKAKSYASKMKSGLNQEKSSRNSYLSATGKTIYKNAKVGYKNSYTYVVMYKSSASNQKAVSAINKKAK